MISQGELHCSVCIEASGGKGLSKTSVKIVEQNRVFWQVLRSKRVGKEEGCPSVRQWSAVRGRCPEPGNEGVRTAAVRAGEGQTVLWCCTGLSS